MALLLSHTAASVSALATASHLPTRLTTLSSTGPTPEGFLPWLFPPTPNRARLGRSQSSESRCCGFQVEEGKGKRREVLFGIALTTLSFPVAVDGALAENAAPDDFRLYTDEENKFKLSIPQDWQVGSGGEPTGFKSITAFYPQELSTCNVSVVITGLGADFTRMESFGKVEAFADILVSGLDRSWKRPPGVAAKLLDCKSANGIYYIDYTLQNPGESRKHLYSAIGMASNGWYNRLYTVTGQFNDEESEKYSSKIEKAVGSFRFI